MVLTRVLAEGVAPQSQGGATLMAGEAAPVEELALSADPLQHIDPLAAEVALLTVACQGAAVQVRLRVRVWPGTHLRG